MGVLPDLVAGVWTGWEDQAIHFEDLSLGQGSNMALPVVGIFLNKVLADPEFVPISESFFEAPANFSIELDCDRAAGKNQRSPYRQQYY